MLLWVEEWILCCSHPCQFIGASHLTVISDAEKNIDGYNVFNQTQSTYKLLSY